MAPVAIVLFIKRYGFPSPVNNSGDSGSRPRYAALRVVMRCQLLTRYARYLSIAFYHLGIAPHNGRSLPLWATSAAILDFSSKAPSPLRHAETGRRATSLSIMPVPYMTKSNATLPARLSPEMAETFSKCFSRASSM